MQEVSQFYRFRPDEIFRRITVTSMVSLMLEQSKLEIQEEDEYARLTAHESEVSNDKNEDVDSAVEDVGSSDDCKDKNDDDEEDMIESVVFKGKMIKRTISVQSHSKSVANLIQGVGSIDIASEYGFRKVSNSSAGGSSGYHHHDSSMAASTFMLPGAENEVLKPELHRSVSEGHLLRAQAPIERKVIDKPYLILDIRSVEEFEAGHIVGARNYPHIRLSRACNFETKDMLAYKNREGKLIIVYDYDEAIAAKFATTLIERGYDNVFMLSGGLRVAFIKFPERLVTTYENADFQTFSEDDIHVLEELLEEALTHGTSRLSTYAPSIMSSRMTSRASVQHPSRSVSPQKRRTLPFQPLRSPLKVNSHRR